MADADALACGPLRQERADSFVDDKIPIFISVGKIYTSDQQATINLLFDYLDQGGCLPVTLDRVIWDPSDPVRAIYALMRRCSGALVIAFPRFLYHDAQEFPDLPAPTPLGDRLVPTIWNQIEAALAYTLKLPLLSVVDARMHHEALLNPAHSAYNIVTMDMSMSWDELPAEVVGALDTFVRLARKKKRPSKAVWLNDVIRP